MPPLPPRETNTKIDDLKEKEKIFKDSIRWLFDAERFKTSYSGDLWRPDGLNEIASIADDTYREAIESVILSRKNFIKAKENEHISKRPGTD